MTCLRNGTNKKDVTDLINLDTAEEGAISEEDIELTLSRNVERMS